MMSLKAATKLAVVLLCAASPIGVVSANEFYAMRKFTFCGVPDTRAGASVTISSVAFSNDGSRAAIATEGRIVRICDTASGRQTASLPVPTSLGKDDDLVGFLAFSPDGTRLVTASSDRRVRIWDLADGRELITIEHTSHVVSVVLSPDGASLATATNNGIVRIWNVADGRERAGFQPPSLMTSVVFSPDGRQLVTTGWDGLSHIWDSTTGREIAVLKGHTSKLTKARYSLDGKRIITASSDNTARVWDAANGRAMLVLKQASQVVSAAFSVDGARIVIGAGKEARIFDAASGREIVILKGHEGGVNDAAFSPDGKRVATASDDRGVRVFDTDSGSTVAEMKGHLYAVNSVTFGPDGHRIFSIGSVEGIMWARLAATRLPESFAGLWFANFDPSDAPEITRERCMRGPITINGDGLIVFFQVESAEPPQTILHLRCAPDLTCQIFAGAPAQGLDSQGVGKIEISGKTGQLCLAGECRPIARCPPLVWTNAERRSGFAKRWETEVHKPHR